MTQRILWGLNAAIASVVLLWLAVGHFQLDIWSVVKPVGGSAVLLILGRRFRSRDPRFEWALEALACISVFTAVAELLSYMIASVGGPLWDARLRAADLSLGLDWLAYLHAVNAHPWLGMALTAAYRSIPVQMVLAILVLGFSGREGGLRVFAGAFMLSGLVSVLISGITPAYANFVHLGLNPADYPNLDPAAAFVHVRTLDGLRSGALTLLSLDGAEGIITFPSYHAALATVFAAAFWEVRAARWAGALLNLLMLLATPIDGGHYFVDVFAGVAIALASILAMRALVRAEAAPVLVSRGDLVPN